MAEARNYNHYLRDLVRRCGAGADAVLDFGAGIGTFSGSLTVPTQRVHCVEPDAASRRKLREQGFNDYADIAEVPDACVPYAFSLNVLEHIDDDAAALADLFRVVQPGGRLLVYVPAFQILFTSMDRHVGHVRRYRRRQLVERVSAAGFTIDKSAYADALGFFATLAYRLVDRSEPAPLHTGSVKFYDRVFFPLSRLLSVLLAKVLGKNVYVVASKPPAADDE